MRLKWIVLALLAVLVAAPDAIAQDMRDPVTGQWISGRGKNLNSAPPRNSGFFSLFGGSSAIDPKRRMPETSAMTFRSSTRYLP